VHDILTRTAGSACPPAGLMRLRRCLRRSCTPCRPA
jgi:hypothetical protein